MQTTYLLGIFWHLSRSAFLLPIAVSSWNSLAFTFARWCNLPKCKYFLSFIYIVEIPLLISCALHIDFLFWHLTSFNIRVLLCIGANRLQVQILANHLWARALHSTFATTSHISKRFFNLWICINKNFVRS